MATDMMSSVVQSVRPSADAEAESIAKAKGTVQVQKMQEAQAVDAAKKRSEAERSEPQNIPDAEELRDLVEQANDMLQVQQRRLQFSVYEETGSQMVQVFDAETDELIRQYPPEEVLSVVEQIQKLMDNDLTGLIFKEQA